MLHSKPLVETVRSHGHRLTHQRRIVLEILNDSQEHLDAEAIYLLAKARDAKISLATVYRSLALLKEVGLVIEHTLGEDHGHFETIQPSPHYHFTCQNCGCIIEFEAPEIETILQNLRQKNGIQVSSAHFHVTGKCPSCQARNN